VWHFAISTSFAAACGIVLLAAAPNAKAQNIHDGLVVHLTFDGNVLDHSGRGNHGVIVRPEAIFSLVVLLSNHGGAILPARLFANHAAAALPASCGR
jgi:hypothetical protein